MAKWRPPVTSETEAALHARGPHAVTHSGYMDWDPAPDFALAWGTARLDLGVHPRGATHADCLRLIDASRQVCERREHVLDLIRTAVLQSRGWASGNLAATCSCPRRTKWSAKM
jgi:hypothetical protein